MGSCLSSKAIVSASPPPLFHALPPETAQPTHPTSTPVPNVTYPSPSMASPSQGNRRNSRHAITPHNGDAMIKKPLSRRGAVERARAQSQDDAVSLRRRRNGGDYPPPSSGGDIFTSRHPDYQETDSHRHPSGRTGPIQRTRSLSMGVTSAQVARSHSSGQGTRAGSVQMPAGRPEGQPLPSFLHSLLPNNVRYVARCRSTSHYYYFAILLRFRILVVGKVSASVSITRDVDATFAFHLSETLASLH
jgi:hypothetical protein